MYQVIEVFILLVLFCTQAAALGEEQYHIVPVNSTSLCEHYPNGTCFTLDTFSSLMGDTKNRTITLSFLPGEHLLTRNMTFNGAYNITLSKEQLSSVAPRISCVGYTQWYISFTHTFTMRGLVINGCVCRDAAITVHDVERFLIQDCEFIDNHNINVTETGGGAIYILRTTAVIKNSVYRNNVCSSGGGALYVQDSTIEINLCTFEKNIGNDVTGIFLHGGAIALITSTGHISNTTFTSNQASGGGGAIYLEMNRTMTISKCIFNNNSADNGGAISAVWIQSEHTKYYLYKSLGNVYNSNTARNGGAVSIEISASFENEFFIDNYARYSGAAIDSDYSTLTLKKIKISSCIFADHRKSSKDNSVIRGRHISAIFTNIILSNNSNTILVTYSNMTFYGQTTISDNTLSTPGPYRTGGALAAISSTITFDKSSTTEISRNEADFGGGFYLYDSKLTVHGNMLLTKNTAVISGGGIFAYESVVEFETKTISGRPKHVIQYIITNNISVSNNTARLQDGGGMYLAASNLKNFNSTVTVSGNQAGQFGGGLFLSYASEINMNIGEYLQNVFLQFRSNSALKGGGIYVLDKTSNQAICESSYDTIKMSEQKKCFITSDYGGLDIVCSNSAFVYIYFDNNTAAEAGSDIYGGLLDRCYDAVIYGTGIESIKYNVGWSWGRNEEYVIQIVDGHKLPVYFVHNTTKLFNHISSDPMKVCFCVDNIVNCTFTHPTVHKKKGKTFSLNVVAVDQVGKPVNATLFSSLKLGKGQGQLKGGQQVIKLTDQCTELEYNVYHSENNAVLELYPEGPCFNQGESIKEVNVAFNICTCPLGFEQQKSLINCSCDCIDTLKPYTKNYWPEEGIFQLKDNNWIQTINNTSFIVHDCPFDFCINEPLNISLAEPSNIQCAFNRTGILCGKCAQGLSVVFASSQCRPCSNYYLFLLLPFGLAGVALVAFILLLNMTVATGTIHGLIFYANILTANRSIFLPFDTPNVLTVFVSWLNLDLGIETCFYDGMDSYGKLMIQLVFPAYLFFLIVAIMVLCDRSQRIARLFGKRNPEATLYTLFLLSYSKLIRTIITALQFTTLNYPDGSQEIVWLHDPNVLYFALNNIPRLLAAIIITILGAVYTSLLLFGQLFNRCSEYPIMKWTSHKYYVHFMKAHHAPLTDNHRYWVGLLLLARLTHYLISAFTNDLIIVLSASIMTLLLLVYKLVFKPYSKKSVNLLETLFIVNLLVFAVATLYVKLSGGDQQVVAIASMSISLIAFLGIVARHILDNCKVKLRNGQARILLALRNRRDYDYRPVGIIESEDEDTADESDEELIDMANVPEETATIEPYDPTRYITPPVIRSALASDQLREPALDDLWPLTSADYNIQPRVPRARHGEAATFTEIVIRK